MFVLQFEPFMDRLSTDNQNIQLTSNCVVPIVESRKVIECMKQA